MWPDNVVGALAAQNRLLHIDLLHIDTTASIELPLPQVFYRTCLAANKRNPVVMFRLLNTLLL